MSNELNVKDSMIFGAAYYEEYLPCDRLEQDMQMMKEAGINTIRIAESTWSVEEPRPGEYDFSHVDRVIDAAEKYGLNVIVGTPTYAVPHWLVQLDPDVLAETAQGKNRFGPRQNMDITNPTYRHYAEGIIRALVSHTAVRPSVIGFQIDNETKHYGVCGKRILGMFREWMKSRYKTIEEVNEALGLNYWSSSVTSFEDLPDPTGTINGSYACEFEIFRRSLAAEFLMWQSDIVKQYSRPDQFITQNFDFQWKSFGAPGQQDGYSFGVQPDICHYEASRAVTLMGTDIYCFDQDALTGREIAFGGDLIRSVKHENYLVLESQAQAFKDWLPYPGQLRQMAWSHVASGACGVMYWNWYSLHNGLESYWKGILSHDFEPNPTYLEVKETGEELRRLGSALSGLRKENRIGLVVSSESLSAMDRFPTDKELCYNDIVHWIYDALYKLNLECDVIFDKEKDWDRYDLLIFPELYCVREEVISHVRTFVEKGGSVFASFRSFYADEHSETKASYRHKYWGSYAALTRNAFGKGHAWYLGTMVPEDKLQEYLLEAAADAGILPETDLRFPLICRNAADKDGGSIHFLFNYSSEDQSIACPWNGEDLLTGKQFARGQSLSLPDWGVVILKEDTDA